MIYSFFSIFLVINIIVSIFYITYKRHYSKIIGELGSYEKASRDDYSKIIQACTLKNGLITHHNVKRLCREYLLKGPEMLNYILGKEIQRLALKKKEDELLPPGLKKVGCKF